MSAARNLKLFTPYLVLTLEGVTHGTYLLWLTLHRGISPVLAASAIAAGELALAVLEVPTGIAADRLGARWSLCTGSALQMLGIALFWWAGSPVAVVGAALAIAAGDAFRDGADESLLYRSLAARGDADAFATRYARSQAWAHAAMMALTAVGGFVARHLGFHVAWALELALAALGLAVAFAMTEPPSAQDARTDDEETGALAGLRRRMPWARIAPAAIVSALATVVELLAQTAPRQGMGADAIALVIAAALGFEAFGAWLVARGVLEVDARTLDAVSIASIGSAVVVALAPSFALPAILVLFVASGVAPVVRAGLVQQLANDAERATMASAATTVEFLARTVSLPLAAGLAARWPLSVVAAAMGAASALAFGSAKAALRCRRS